VVLVYEFNFIAGVVSLYNQIFIVVLLVVFDTQNQIYVCV